MVGVYQFKNRAAFARLLQIIHRFEDRINFGRTPLPNQIQVGGFHNYCHAVYKLH